MVVSPQTRPRKAVVPMGIVTERKPAPPEAKTAVRMDRILGSDRFVVGTCQRG